MKKGKSIKSVFANFSIKEFAVDNIYYILGCILYAAGVNIFAIPNNIAQSGIINALEEKGIQEGDTVVNYDL